MSWEWAGEWTVTYETFRDMGAAFVVALVLIYILVVWEFGNFRIPLVIMAPIPLTLLGIIPAHFVMFALGMGGEFTATSMIGWIALAGIIVRNSILLVDFSIHEIQKGVPVDEAVIRACKIRTRPILITALALVAGSSVIITDPDLPGHGDLAAGRGPGVHRPDPDRDPPGLRRGEQGYVRGCQRCTARRGVAVSVANGVAGAQPRGIWGWSGQLLLLLFDAVRGIGLLLIDGVKGVLPRAEAPHHANQHQRHLRRLPLRWQKRCAACC